MSFPTALTVLVLFFTVLTWWFRRPSGLPPGPPRLFFGLGDNTQQVPKVHPWRTFTEWNKQYGPLVSFYFGRTPVIMLGTAQAAWDLLDKRAEIYSGRPRSIMAGEILSWGVRNITNSYGPRFKRWRALMQASLSHTASAQYQSLQSLESKFLLKKLLNLTDPMEYKTHLSVFQMSVTFRIAYGRRVRSVQDEIVQRYIKAGGWFGKLSVPGKYLVESWPILLWLPHRLQWFRHPVEAHRVEDLALYSGLMNRVRSQMADGTAQPSMATLALSKQVEFGLSNLEMAYTLAGPWDAGVGTTLTNLETFLLAMLHFPETMKKAQKELDEVVGSARMPEFSDMDSLPYLNALMKETQRWRPMAPTGFPHALMADDTYEGYFLPKGATVYANISAIMRDPALFPDADTFRPERFIETDNPRLTNFMLPFGFGRRICPGQHIATQSIFIAVSRLLWAYDVVPVKGEDGTPVIPSADAYTTGLVSRPEPFPCTFKLRSAALEELIGLEADRAEAEAARWDTD